jgi:PAS domain S-box-containing protein
MNAPSVTAALRQAAAHHHPSLVWIATPDGSWVELHENWAQLTGKSVAQSLGQGWQQCMAESQRERIVQQWQEALRQEQPVSIDVALMRADGSEQAMSLHSRRVLSEQGVVNGYVGCLEAKSELQGQLREAQAQLERLRAGVQVRDQFLAVLSHELRTPLSGIQSWAYVLERTLDANAPTLQRALSGIKTGVQQQVKLIDDLMDAAQVISGRVSLQHELLPPHWLFEQAVARLRERLDEKGLSVRQPAAADAAGAAHPAGTAALIDGDRARTVQIVENILANAIRFSTQGGAIELTIERDAREVRLGVTDFGRGIAAQRLLLLQEPAAQAAATEGTDAAWQPAGVGLKLALTRRLLELHGAHLSVYSEGEGKGARFVMHFPLAAPAAA